MSAIATFSGLPESDEDRPRLKQALAAVGVDVEPVVWAAPDVDWSACELVVVRTTWDYVQRLAEFLAWADEVPTLLNPAPALRWNRPGRPRRLRRSAMARVGCWCRRGRWRPL